MEYSFTNETWLTICLHHALWRFRFFNLIFIIIHHLNVNSFQFIYLSNVIITFLIHIIYLFII